MSQVWTAKELDILRQEYPLGGYKRVKDLLPRHSYNAILWRAHMNNIRLFCRYPGNEMDVRWLTNPTTPEAAYVLGLLWGDGCVSVNTHAYRVSIGLRDIDFSEIYTLFGEWRFFVDTHEDQPTWQVTYIARLSHKRLALFLQDYDYTQKSSTTPIKILGIVPLLNQRYFFRGWFDADGSNVSLLKGCRSLATIAGAFYQNWKVLEDLCDRLDITYDIDRYKGKRGKGSSFVFNTIRSNARFFRYIYSGKPFGLSRKYHNYQEFIKHRIALNDQRKIKPKGVQNIDRRYVGECWITGQKHHLGSFNTAEEAAEAFDCWCWMAWQDETMLNHPEHFVPNYFKTFGVDPRLLA